jgi:hypothetical protein
VIGNVNSSEAFQRIVYGIQSGQIEMLRTIGINVNFENSYAKVAKATGRVTAQLSEAEKSQIRMNVVMESGKMIAGTYEAAMGTAGKQVLSLERHVENLKVGLGLAFTPALAEIIETITGAIVGLNGELSGESREKIADWGNNFRLTIISIEAEIIRLAMLVDKIGGTKTSLDMMGAGVGSALGISKKTSPILATILGSKEEFEAAADANTDYENRYKASEKTLEDLAKKYIAIEQAMTPAGKAAAKAALEAAEAKILAARKTEKVITEESEAEKKLREEYEKMKFGLQEDIKLTGLEGIRKEFAENLVTAEKARKEAEQFPPTHRKIINALIDEKKALADKGVIDKAVVQSREDDAEAIEKERRELEHLKNVYEGMVDSLNPYLSALNEYNNRLEILSAMREKGQPVDDNLEAIATYKYYEDVASIASDYYSRIAGFEQTSLEYKLHSIEAQRKANELLYGDKVAAAKLAEQQVRDAILDNDDLIKNNYDKEHKYQKESIENAIAVFNNASDLMSKESKEYKIMQDAKKAMQIAELAMEIEKNVQIVEAYFARSTAAVASAAIQNTANASTAVTGAVASVAAQGTVPVAGFGMVAAMLAIMAGVLGMAGIAFGGGSSSSGISTANMQKSTVLGAEDGTGSQSVANSYEMLKDIYDIEDTKLTKIYDELRDLNTNITGLVTSIVRTGGISAEGMGINVGTTLGNFEKSTNLYIAQNMGILSDIGNILNQPIQDIGNFIFGGKVKKSVTESGISFGSQNIADILSGGMNAQQYADIATKKSGWFGSSKTSYSTQYQALDESVSAMFNQVFQGLGNTLVAFAPELGKNVSDILNYTFEQSTLNLQDMSTEDMTKAINEYISNASDKAVETLFGDVVGKYQQLDEGLLETATRLIIDKEIVASIMEDTGKSLTGTVPEMIAFSESLIEIAGGLDALSEAAQSYIDKFYTDAEKYTKIKEAISDVVGVLPKTREAYRALVDSIDLTSEVGKTAYVTLLNLAETADSYYSHIEEIATQRASMEITLLEAQGKTAEALAAKRQQELDAMDESLRPLQELIWLTQDLGTSLETITTETSTAINELISNSSSAASEARSAAQTYKNLIDTFTDAQIKIFGGGKAGAQTRFDDIYKTAMTGDATALGKMPGAIDTLLEESLKSASTSLEYRRDQAKSYIALEQAKTVSAAMVNWEEYHATLLETQTKVLEEMRDELAEPSPDLIELQKHAELLGNIATLLSEQTVQVVKGNTYVQDQTGKIVAQTAVVGVGNSYAQDQIGKIIAGNDLTTKQTAQVITGNAVQDTIKNIDSLNTAYTADMLTALVNGGTGQQNSLLSILQSSQTVVSLLSKLVSATEANAQAAKAKEIEMSKAEYLSSVGDREAALTAYNSAITATSAAKEKMNIEGSQYLEAQRVAAAAAQIYTNQPTAANLATLQAYMSAADSEYAQFSAAQANYNTIKSQEDAALRIYNEASATVTNLKAVTNALIDVYNAQYPTAKIPALAEGGYVMVGENGPELARFGSSARVYSNKDSKSLVNNSELIAEIKALRADVKTMGRALKVDTQKQVSLLNTLNDTGILTRVA